MYKEQKASHQNPSSPWLGPTVVESPRAPPFDQRKYVGLALIPYQTYPERHSEIYSPVFSPNFILISRVSHDVSVLITHLMKFFGLNQTHTNRLFQVLRWFCCPFQNLSNYFCIPSCQLWTLNYLLWRELLYIWYFLLILQLALNQGILIGAILPVIIMTLVLELRAICVCTYHATQLFHYFCIVNEMIWLRDH